MKLASWVRGMPWSIPTAACLLMGVGWLAIARIEEWTEGSGRFLHQQMAYSAIAVAVMFLATIPSYRMLWRWSYPLFFAALGLLAAVYFFPPINNARRWMRIGPVGLQPSELAKVAYVLGLARYLMYRANYRRLRGLLGPLLLTVAPMLLILREPDLGTAVVFLPLFFIVLFAAGAKRLDLACVVLAGLLVAPVLWTQMSGGQRARVASWFDQPSASRPPTDQGYQVYQAKQVRAMGGVWGSYFSGSATDDAAAYRLPEAQSDFVFCVVGERIGLPGTLFVLGLYAWIVWKAAAIAMETREPFGRLLAVGVGALFAVETLIHTGVTLGLLPVTGLSLPMVSHGGSGLVAHALALGLLMNVGLRPGYEVGNEPFRYVGEGE